MSSPIEREASLLSSECGAHCGVVTSPNERSPYRRVGHCENCHARICQASMYDRGKVKPA